MKTCVTCGQNLPPDRLEEAGATAIDVAFSHWLTDIYDPKSTDVTPDALRCKGLITQYIQKGIGWTWEPPYRGDGTFEWCGAFAAECWRGVKPELRKLYFASTYRLDRYARYQSAFGEKNEGTGRKILELDESTKVSYFLSRWTVEKGDILLIGSKGYGQHICLVESFDRGAGVFHTIEGNGTGDGPQGERQQGVVRGMRYLGTTKIGGWCARRIIRPSAEDLTPR